LPSSLRLFTTTQLTGTEQSSKTDVPTRRSLKPRTRDLTFFHKTHPIPCNPMHAAMPCQNNRFPNMPCATSEARVAPAIGTPPVLLFLTFPMPDLECRLV